MIVHLIGSIKDFDKDPLYIRSIIDCVHDNGSVLAHNWLEPALMRKKENIYIADWTPFVENDLVAIKAMDIVIAELTHYNFSQGFQIAAALEQKKPVLAIARHSVKGKMASGIINPLFTHKQYNSEEELQAIVQAFLAKNTVHTKDLRFNIFFTRRILQYLENKTRETGKTRSEIIRDIIKHKIDSKSRGHDD